MRDQHAFITSDSDGQCPEGGGLIDHEQDAAMVFELGEQCSQFCFIVRQSTVEQALASTVQGDGMMRTLAHVDTDEDLDSFCLSRSIMHKLPVIHTNASDTWRLILAST